MIQMNKTNDDAFIFSSLEEATGALPYGLTNDYMFRAVLQKNNFVLRGLIGALLHLSEDEMVSVEITNPIVLGEAIESKEFRLDINVVLNNSKRINLEMQVENLYNWVNRSLSYLCRSYDNLTKGQDYDEVQPVIHIGILDYSLFPELHEFYAKYKMMNVRNHHIYSDNFELNVLDLKSIRYATDVDKYFKIDYWARLFKSKTWEELKHMANDNEYFKAATETIYSLSAEEEIRKRCRDREDYYADLRGIQKMMDEKDRVIAEKDVLLSEKDDLLSERDNLLSKKDSLLSEKDDLISKQVQELELLRAQLAQLQNN